MSRFWSKVSKRKSGCWIWTAGRTSDRYGCFSVKNKPQLAHRVAWEIENGPIPSGMNVLHSCDNGLCCRPSHLFLGNQLANIADRHAKDRDAHQRGEKCGMSILTNRDVKKIKRLLKAGNHFDREIAALFNVARVTINHIRKGRTWSHIT